MKKVSTLRLGDVDGNLGITAELFVNYLKLYYQGQKFPVKDKLLNESNTSADGRFISYRTVGKGQVKALTRSLQSVGFMPNANNDGFFGYGTEGAVRLFQEYVRTRDTTISKAKRKEVIPDGLAGPITLGHLNRWVKQGLRPDWLAGDHPDERAIVWLNRFRATAFYLQVTPTPMVKIATEFSRTSDTLPIGKWRFSLTEPQLFGIRRNADRREDRIRGNDDLFVLIINGRAFTFFGSTDVNPDQKKLNEAFLIDGQHRYRFAWHKVGKSVRHKTYRALRPAGKGVIVVRDNIGANALTDAVIKGGLDQTPNGTINIHWSGEGSYNQSAGCQVIGGRKYLGPDGQAVSCHAFAARKRSALGKTGDPPRFRTKAAYNLLADLLLVYGPKGTAGKPPVIRYTLFSENTLIKAGAVTAEEMSKLRRRFD